MSEGFYAKTGGCGKMSAGRAKVSGTGLQKKIEQHRKLVKYSFRAHKKHPILSLIAAMKAHRLYCEIEEGLKSAQEPFGAEQLR